jgi:hypothetical protein
MTINVLRGRRARAAEAPAEPLPIGDEDGQIFGCPTCSRPLATGASRCPGCGTHLLMGVQARRASLFIVFGVAAGVLVGIALAFVIAIVSQPAAAVPGTGTNVVPDAPPAATAVPAVDPAPAIPAMSLAAFAQSANVNVRLAGSVSVLQAQLAAPEFDTIAAATAIRAIAAEAAMGSDLAPRLAAWADARDLAATLRDFYGDVRTTARRGLAASLTNSEAYRIAAAEMIVALGGLGAIDARTQEIAAAAGVTVPKVALPAVTAPDAPATPDAAPAPEAPAASDETGQAP